MSRDVSVVVGAAEGMDLADGGSLLGM